MKRAIWDELLYWKSRKDHKPLIIRGVRQCGKTWIIKEFSKKSYPDFAYFNFEGNPNLHVVFETDLDPVRIIK